MSSEGKEFNQHRYAVHRWRDGHLPFGVFDLSLPHHCTLGFYPGTTPWQCSGDETETTCAIQSYPRVGARAGGRTQRLATPSSTIPLRFHVSTGTSWQHNPPLHSHARGHWQGRGPLLRAAHTPYPTSPEHKIVEPIWDVGWRFSGLSPCSAPHHIVHP